MMVLVCGGRHFDDAPMLRKVLNDLHREHAFTSVIHGGAPGADELAGWWAEGAGLQPTAFLPDWKVHGKAAGPLRNQRMLDAVPGLVVAFPGGRGTADMTRRARAAGVRVIEVQATLSSGVAQKEKT